MRLRNINLLIIGFMLLIIVLSSFVSAYSIGNKSHEITTTYSPGEKLSGWINISLNNDASDSLISLDSSNVTIKDLLDNNLADYACSPDDCEDKYVSSNPSQSKSFSLNSNEKIISFLLTGNINSINSISFNVSAANEKSCFNPLSIDVLDDDSYEYNSRKVSDETVCSYEQGKGCFNDSQTQLTEIDAIPYCEKIKLLASEKFQLGAWVKKGTTAWSNGLLKMFLYSLNGEELENCNLAQPSSAGGEISCIVNYSNPELNDFYVCIKANHLTDYQTKREDNNPCGFYSFPGEETEYHDYYIFAKSAKFDNTGKFSFAEEWTAQGNSDEFADFLSNYISEKYSGNCSSGCSIPIRFKAYGNVNVVVSELKISYSTGAGPVLSDRIYEASTEKAKINSDFLILNLDDAGLLVPSEYGNHTIILNFNSNTLFSEKINIIKIPKVKSVYPLSAPAAVSITFHAEIDNTTSKNITGYEWDFGDESGLIYTSASSARHEYSEIGSYILTLKVNFLTGESTESRFNINVISPENYVREKIPEYRKNLNNISLQINSFTWYKDNFEKLFLDEMDSGLKTAEQKLTMAGTEEDYVEIAEILAELKIPSSMKIISGSMRKFVSAEDIDLSALIELGAGEIESENEEAYKQAIAAWFNNNIEARLDYKTVSFLYEESVENVYSVFSLKLAPKESADGAYLVINEDFEDGKINTDINSKSINGNTGIVLDLSSEKIIEAANPYINPVSLIIYASPGLSDLEIAGINIMECNYNKKCEAGETWKNCRSDCKPWGWVVFWIGLVLFAALIVYLILAKWYSVNYEKSLFKDRNNLFNLVNFISNGINQNFDKGLIKSKLRQAGWTGEQITYAFKKVEGKFIGMPFSGLFRRKQAFNPNNPPVPIRRI